MKIKERNLLSPCRHNHGRVLTAIAMKVEMNEDNGAEFIIVF
jgi:hypothetical protein